ncbi:deoxyuridine 5'-triphosphate nucleotidohydrolase [Candidatus Bipolaricaulota bacterium]|nr:deoxyuridine 5'-triphosphate nucleotidohydrolase [Candidatus Bipolaricaulota bacterium]
MIISGEGFVENFVDQSVQRQEAGVDLTVKEIERFTEAGRLDFDNSSRRIASGEDISGEELEGGTSYRITYNEKVSVPEDAMGLVFPRSSLMRNGCHLVTAVWDPGYEGRGQGLLQVLNPRGIVLADNARVGQLVFFRLEREATEGYDGRYQGENM